VAIEQWPGGPSIFISAGNSRLAATGFCYPKAAVRMIWWFLILGVSTLVVVCVTIALYIHLRRHLQKAHSSPEENVTGSGRQTNSIRH